MTLIMQVSIKIQKEKGTW